MIIHVSPWSSAGNPLLISFDQLLLRCYNIFFRVLFLCVLKPGLISNATRLRNMGSHFICGRVVGVRKRHHKYNDAQLWNVREARTLYSRLCQIKINYYWGYNRWMIAHTVISLYLPAFRGPPMSTQWLFRCWSTYRALDRSKYVLPQLTFWDLNPDMVNKPLLSLNHRKKVYCSWADTPPGSPPPSKIFLPANNNQRSDM